MKQWLSILFLLSNILFVSVLAGVEDKRAFNSAALDNYRHNPEFDYSQDYVPTDSFISTVLAYVFSKIGFLFDSLALKWIMPIVFRIAIILGFVAALIVILKLKFSHAFSKGSSRFNNLPVTNIENEKEDFERLMKESLDSQQYKLAVRYLFLSTLVMLERQNSIKITNWKAPYEYMKELPENKKSFFKQLTDLFENTWYGDYLPDNDAVNQGIQHYRNLKNA